MPKACRCAKKCVKRKSGDARKEETLSRLPYGLSGPCERDSRQRCFSHSTCARSSSAVVAGAALKGDDIFRAGKATKKKAAGALRVQCSSVLHGKPHLLLPFYKMTLPPAQELTLRVQPVGRLGSSTRTTRLSPPGGVDFEIFVFWGWEMTWLECL